MRDDEYTTWGNSFRIPDAPVLFTSQELVRAEAPAPCEWKVLCSFQYTGAGDTLILELRLGLGRVVLDVEVPLVVGAGVNAFNTFDTSFPIPAQTLSARLRRTVGAGISTGAIAVAPVVPWTGLRVSAERARR